MHHEICHNQNSQNNQTVTSLLNNKYYSSIQTEKYKKKVRSSSNSRNKAKFKDYKETIKNKTQQEINKNNLEFNPEFIEGNNTMRNCRDRGFVNPISKIKKINTTTYYKSSSNNNSRPLTQRKCRDFFIGSINMELEKEGARISVEERKSKSKKKKTNLKAVLLNTNNYGNAVRTTVKDRSYKELSVLKSHLKHSNNYNLNNSKVLKIKNKFLINGINNNDWNISSRNKGRNISGINIKQISNSKSINKGDKTTINSGRCDNLFKLGFLDMVNKGKSNKIKGIHINGFSKVYGGGTVFSGGCTKIESAKTQRSGVVVKIK